ncbi:S-locus glycoprotein domain [Sesbania bispinosa]|nr:S-locus glycoprotein domain [Sesbania bispinosa]
MEPVLVRTKNECDNYGTCGSNSNCDPLNFEDFRVVYCLPGFEPRFPRDWYENRDGSGGCVRKKGASVCGNGEGFVKIEGLKVPDTSVAIAKGGLSLEECEQECLRNCSCTAYAVADARNGGSGCLAWHDNLMDTQKLSDQANYYKKRNGEYLVKGGWLQFLQLLYLQLSFSSLVYITCGR